MRKIFKLLTLFIAFAQSSALENGFVYVSGADPTIKIDLKYASENNFIGEKILKYNSTDAVILTLPAAEAIQRAQHRARKLGYSIVIYDAYRPESVSNFFYRWSQNKNDQKMKKFYYPRIDKSMLFELGYFSEKSSHSRASSVDVTLIKHKKKITLPRPVNRKFKDDFEYIYLDDGTLDMGTSYDFFDRASHTQTSLITLEQQKNRKLLKNIMEKAGFENHSEKWWHYTLKNEPFPEKYFDFEIEHSAIN